MHADTFRLDAYLKRIGFIGTPAPDFATLKQMMQRQLRTVPFENLDVRAGKIVSIDLDDIVAKIIPTQRGGYCYEVNSLFAMALSAIGTPYTLAGARPMTFPERRARTHMVIIATIEGKQYLCDTGYGRLAIREPMDLDLIDTPVLQDHDTYRLILKDGEYIAQARMPDGWDNLYSFNLDRFELVDFVPANWFNSTSPDAIFTQTTLLMRHTDDGRILLVDDYLRVYAGGEVIERTVAAEDLPVVIEDLFGITPTEDTSARL
ncbi:MULTISPECIES: arylamine N-acetyltransferase [Asticcacaulis]|uniref:arylamine N-acetyltransferase family protein n=1 Tax=Asticcacaulis TaxID=76890 RepID=UPI001AEA3D51|nr:MULTISPECIES: arylamine N-acetyltransferase [Asticcacaulis]MBP2158748.1 N-hydroxyarylamine O-acetyltransferase [Asticcacaulis solisilvae]MDR6799794.1 N-hydroxyarylamine O-acetyltransferase [Asticcacaulis sp. BE141]